MTDPKHERLRHLFDRALDLAQGERRAYLERECGGDTVLKGRVEALIAAAEDERFLKTPTGPATATTAPLREGPGTRIGPYKLLQAIGEGGFGVVFMAEQEKPVARRVALKIIKLGMDTHQVVARFEQERQALALMEHPNIARVIDAGATETGRPYFVMELVAGKPITEYCDEHRLSIDDRLALFEQVCHAVQHAHSKGIIHRDIKPSNILVATSDGRPLAKVIDFGIAKATSAKLTDKTLFTEHQQVIGTLQYMSPEQAEGSLDLDTRTDVYALGVVLYELLTGSTPFDRATFHRALLSEVQRMIREVDPPKPSTRISQSVEMLASIAARRNAQPRRLGMRVRGELDWIVMKALEKDRARRYDTASGFASDLRSFLSGEPIAAAPPSATYRFRKFVRRHRVAVVAGSAVVVALVAGAVAFAWQARIASTERDRAVAAEAAMAKQANELRLVSEFQTKMLDRVDPTEAGIALARDLRLKHAAALAKAGVPESERPVREQAFSDELARVNATDAAMGIVDGAILQPAVGAIAKQFADQPVVGATLRQSLASSYTKFGRYEQALPLQEAALEARRKELGDSDPDTLRSINDMAVLLEKHGEYARAEPLYREALDGWRKTRGAESEDVQSMLMNLGGNLRFQSNDAEAESMLRESLELARRVRGDDARETLICENVLAYLLRDQGRVTEAEPLCRDSYTRGRKLFGPDDPDVLVWTHNLGGVLDNMGQLAEAGTYYREAYDGARRVHGEEHPSTLVCARSLAANLQQRAMYAEAETLQRATLEATRRVLGPDHPDTIGSLSSIGVLLKAEGKLAEAEPYLRGCVETSRRVLGKEHVDTLKASAILASLLEAMGQSEEAERMYRELLATPKSVWGNEHPDRLVVMNNLGVLLIGHGRSNEAEGMLREALATRIRTSGPEHPETLVLQSCVGRVLEDQGKLAEAESTYRDATAKFRSALGDKHPNTGSSLGNLGGVLLAENEYAEAETVLREAIAVFESTLGSESAKIGSMRLLLGKTLTKVGQLADAEQELLEAQRVLTSAQGVTPGKIESSRKALAALYDEWEKAEPGKGHKESAEQWR